jgi:hypothetical protein
MKYLDYPPIWLLGFMGLTWGGAQIGLRVVRRRSG